jgi:hypothetical protein
VTFACQVCLVGSRHYSAFGAHGADSHVNFSHFATLEDCCRHLKDHEGECSIVVLLAVSRPSAWPRSFTPSVAQRTHRLCASGCEIIGVEIMDNAQPVQSHPFSGPTAFMIGNEASPFAHVWLNCAPCRLHTAAASEKSRRSQYLTAHLHSCRATASARSRSRRAMPSCTSRSTATGPRHST